MLLPYLLISVALTLTVTYIYAPEISKLTQRNNDLTEIQTKTVGERSISALNNLLRTTQKLSVDFSNLQAKYYALIQAIAYGTVTLLITYYVVYNQVTVGSVFSTYRYLFDFCGAISSIPVLLWSFANIRDVIKRLDEE
jgi:ABC-type multidrug transport system fused ATPase/permease subunit